MDNTLHETERCYFTIGADPGLRNACELRMLEENRIGGLLRLSVCEDEGQLVLNYDTTGWIPLSEFTESRHLTASEIRCLILTLKHVISGLSPFLLDQRGIMLSPDTVFLDPVSASPAFLYVPEQTDAFQENLTLLLQAILSNVDHDDYRSVVLAYRLYKESLEHRTENVLDCLERILISPGAPEETGLSHPGSPDISAPEYIPEELLRTRSYSVQEVPADADRASGDAERYGRNTGRIGRNSGQAAEGTVPEGADTGHDSGKGEGLLRRFFKRPDARPEARRADENGGASPETESAAVPARHELYASLYDR